MKLSDVVHALTAYKRSSVTRKNRAGDSRVPLLRSRRTAVLVVAAASLLGVGTSTTAAFAVGGRPPPRHTTTLFVTTTGSSSKSDTSCVTAGYAAIQTAVNAATAGQTVYVCPGTYGTQVTIDTSRITLTGAGNASVVEPTTSTPSTVNDLTSGQATVTIIDVSPGTTGVTVKNLAVNGSGLQPNFKGCADDFVGVLYQASSGTLETATVGTIALPPALAGCQDGNAVIVEAGSDGRANVTIHGDTVTGFNKNGITCDGAGANCTISGNTVVGLGATAKAAQNDVQIGFGALGQVTHNTLQDVDWTGATTKSEPQATYAAGVLVDGSAGVTRVQGNTLTNDQIAIETTDSSSTLQGNHISDTPGISGAIGVFAVTCTIYCSYFTLSPGREQVWVASNSITFGTPTTGTTGIWVGDGAGSTTGSLLVDVTGNTISGAANNIVLGSTASGTVSTLPSPPGPPSRNPPGPPPRQHPHH
ncbi:MAG: hypothetical protein ACRDY3_09725 [Acidimicrobiales bacterium]